MKYTVTGSRRRLPSPISMHLKDTPFTTDTQSLKFLEEHFGSLSLSFITICCSLFSSLAPPRSRCKYYFRGCFFINNLDKSSCFCFLTIMANHFENSHTIVVTSQPYCALMTPTVCSPLSYSWGFILTVMHNNCWLLAPPPLDGYWSTFFKIMASISTHLNFRSIVSKDNHLLRLCPTLEQVCKMSNRSIIMIIIIQLTATFDVCSGTAVNTVSLMWSLLCICDSLLNVHKSNWVFSQ